MKILVLPSFYPNSYRPLVGIFFHDHALALQAAGHDVIVLAVVAVSLRDIWKEKKFNFGFTRQNNDGITTYHFQFPSIPKLRWLNNMIRTLVGWNIYCMIRKQHGYPNIVHVHSYLAGDLARKIKQQDAVPYFVTEHSSAFARDFLSATEQKLAYRVFHEASARIAVSVKFKQILTERYGLPFLYIPNPVGLRGIITDMDSRFIKADRKRIRICNVAYLDVNKRQDRLIRAFNLMVSKFSDIELHIAGDGPKRKELKKLVEKLGLGSRVTFHGLLRRQDVFQLMLSCDVFALSSDYETFGVVLIEAMACGLPVVATRCGGPESIITEEWLGLLTNNDDASFSKGLLDMVKRVQENCFDAKRISAYAHNVYSYEAIGQRMTEIIFRSIQ